MIFSVPMLVEAAKQNPAIYAALYLNWPSITSGLSVVPSEIPSVATIWTKAGIGGSIGDASSNLTSRRVLEFGTVERSVNQRDSSLTLLEAGVLIDDQDGYFSKILGTGIDLRGMTAAIYLRLISGSNVANQYTAIAGVVYDFKQEGTGSWRLYIRTNDSPLVSPVPRLKQRSRDWVNLDKAARGKLAPVIYGAHISCWIDGGSATGALPTLYVDTVGFRYLVSFGWTTVYAVYVDGTRATSGYTITHPKISGITFTLIDFTSSQGTSEITADVFGYETVGDGTGTLIYAPADCMKHFLANFVYYEATGGVWNTTDDRANVDTTLWTTWQARYYGNPTAFSCSRYIGESTTAIDELQSWAATFQASLFFTPSGTIGIRFDPLTTPVDTSVLQAYRLGANLRNLTPAFNTQDLYKRVSGNYRFFASQAQYQEELTVFNQPAKINSADPIDLSWGPVY